MMTTTATEPTIAPELRNRLEQRTPEERIEIVRHWMERYPDEKIIAVPVSVSASDVSGHVTSSAWPGYTPQEQAEIEARLQEPDDTIPFDEFMRRIELSDEEYEQALKPRRGIYASFRRWLVK